MLLTAAAGLRATGAGAIANAGTCQTTHASIDGDEKAMVDAINEERIAAGLAPYLVSANLSQVSAWMAEDVATSGVFSHTDSAGRSPHARGNDCVGTSIAENIAGGYFGGPEGVVNAWMGSPGHRGNLLGTTYASIGVGRFGNIWVTNFSIPALDGVAWAAGGSAPPAATATPSPRAPSATPTPTAIPTSTPTPPPTTSPTPTNVAPPTTGERQLAAGVNFLTHTGPTQRVDQAMRSVTGQVIGIYRWDAAAKRWLRYFPDAPQYINTLVWLESGDAYFFVMNSHVTWTY